MSVSDAALPLYTVDEYFGLVDAGRPDPDARVELLEGVVVEMSPSTPRHAASVGLINRALREAFGLEVRVGQPFIAGSRSGPEPDLAVVAGRPEEYVDRHPTEALLVVEVSVSSLPVDRLSKSRIYAAAGVPEYWIANLVEAVLEVHRDPDPVARIYRETSQLRAGQSITPLGAPGSSIDVADLLPPSTGDSIDL